ncbi:hypothetical protein [Roseicella aerolata]|uniref:Uncharacterized protein n=1 Tax=Roseicella aerolata TaxID=2883479 RepID=A0A9X1IHP4_9PROT|nr:hypothetical protein [Roseicella aerolata]MCB4823573.1 hypothetical protein [Roseicella aerolata]
MDLRLGLLHRHLRLRLLHGDLGRWLLNGDLRLRLLHGDLRRRLLHGDLRGPLLHRDLGAACGSGRGSGGSGIVAAAHVTVQLGHRLCRLTEPGRRLLAVGLLPQQGLLRLLELAPGSAVRILVLHLLRHLAQHILPGAYGGARLAVIGRLVALTARELPFRVAQGLFDGAELAGDGALATLGLPGLGLLASSLAGALLRRLGLRRLGLALRARLRLRAGLARPLLLPRRLLSLGLLSLGRCKPAAAQQQAGRQGRRRQISVHLFVSVCLALPAAPASAWFAAPRDGEPHRR